MQDCEYKKMLRSKLWDTAEENDFSEAGWASDKMCLYPLKDF